MLPESVAQFEVSEEHPESAALNNHHNSRHSVDPSEVYKVPDSFQDILPAEDVPQDLDPPPSSEELVAKKMQLDEVNINEMSTIGDIIQAASKARTPVQALRHDSSIVFAQNTIKRDHQGPKHAEQGLDSYFQRLFEKAITMQAELEAKARMEQKAIEEAEWRQRLEESIRLKAEVDVRQQIERARLDSERERVEEQQKRAASEAYKKQALEEAKHKAEEAYKKLG